MIVYRSTSVLRMQNAECRMIVSALPTILNYFRRKYYNFALCIMHFAFCIRPLGR